MTLAEKTIDLLRTGRVTLHYVSGSDVIADVRGDHALRRVTLSRSGWHCSCAAHEHGQRCSHVTALALLVDHPTRFDAVEAVNT